MHKGYFRVEADGAGGFRFIRASDGAMLEASPAMPEVTDVPDEPAAVAEPAGGTGERLTSYGMSRAIEALSRTA